MLKSLLTSKQLSIKPSYMDTQQKAMQNFTASWYNYLVKTLTLSDQSFQLVQGSMPLGATSAPLFQMADSVPPNTVNYLFESSQWNRFSSDYQELLYAQLETSSNQLQRLLGDQYNVWISYRINYFKQNPTSTLSQQQVFDQWANTQSSLDPNTINEADSIFASAGESPLATARLNFANQNNYLLGQPVYNKAIADVQADLLRGLSATINYDSTQYSSDVSSTWAEGGVFGLFDFFSAEGGGTLSIQNSKAIGSSVVITGTISKYTTVPIGPGAWFSSGVFNNAFANKDNNYVWDVASQCTWETCFGPTGDMQRVIGSLLVIDGIDITITSMAEYTQDDTSTLNTESSVGIWPFFFGEADTTTTTKFYLNSDSTLSARIQSNYGNPKIFGVNVLSAGKAFQGSAT
jgi:hypothetical protein